MSARYLSRRGGLSRRALLVAGVPGGGAPGPSAELDAADGLFDRAYYLASNPDVAGAGAEPWIHYFKSGHSEGRNPGVTFDTAAYKAAFPDWADNANPVWDCIARGRTPIPVAGIGTATKFALSTPQQSGPVRVGSPVTVVARPLDGKWPTGTSITVTGGGVTGTASGPITPTAGTVAPATCTFTPGTSGYGLLTGTATGLSCVGQRGIIAVAPSALPPIQFKGRSGGHLADDVLEACTGFGLGHVQPSDVLQVGGVPVAVTAASTWWDGSVKVGKLRAKLPSGLAAGATWGGVPTTDGVLSGSPPALSGLPAITLTITPSGGSAQGIDLKAAAVAAPTTTFKRRVAGRILANAYANQVRTVTAVAGSSPGFAVVTDVELRSDGSTWVDCWFRNETSGVGATTAAYTATLVQDGVTVWSKTVAAHEPFRAWGRLTGTKAGALARRPAQLQVPLLVDYLADHGFLPRYDTAHPPTGARLANYASSTAAASWDRILTNQDTDYSARRIRLDMSDYGGRPDIGPNTGHQVAWLVSGDQRAEDFALGQAEDAGSIPWHMLDASADGGSGVYWRSKEHPGGGYSYQFNPPNRPTPLWSDAPGGWSTENAHQPSLAYAPFLLTGREAFRDELMAAATHAIMHDASMRDGSGGIFDVIVQSAATLSARASAWSLREIHYASICAAPGSADEAYFKGALNANLDYLQCGRAGWKALQGEPYGYLENSDTTGQIDHTAGYMQHYNSLVIAQIARQDARALTYVLTFGSHWWVGAFGRGDFAPAVLCLINIFLTSGSNGPRATTYAQLQANAAARDPTGANGVISAGFGYYNWQGDYVTLAEPALATYADLGIAGALLAWQAAVAQAGSYNSIAYVTGGDNSDPHDCGMTWSIVPKGVARA